MSRNRKEEAVQDALIRHYDKYYRLAFSYVHNEADAMDIVQEGAYKAILKSDSLKNVEFADTWIYRIMINEAFSLLRKQKETTDIEEAAAVHEDTYENIDLRQAIAKLDPKDRTIVTLRFFEDMRLDEIADIMEENLNTVKSRLYRVMNKLKIVLQD